MPVIAILVMLLTACSYNKAPSVAIPKKTTQAPFIAPSFKSGVKDWRSLNWAIDSDTGTSSKAYWAWMQQKKSNPPIVGVVDTGIDATHPILRNHLTGAGFDFTTNLPKPTDTHGHGTHISGIILAVSNFQAKILPVKFYSDHNSGIVNLRNSIKALNYAIDNGARIINYSGGGPEFSYDELAVLRRAEAKGILVVAAAGNEGQSIDLDDNKYYPASYGLSNIIVVGSYRLNGTKARSSNFGANSVNVGAPGEDIYSTLPGGQMGYMSGTSQATAVVTGIAAMMLSENTQLTAVDLKRMIEGSANKVPALEGLVVKGKVDAQKAMIEVKTFKTARSFTSVRE